IHLIQNGVDLANFAFEDRHPQRGIKRAVTVARLNEVKDQATMLRALRRLIETKPDFTLDIVGDGPERQSLHSLAAELSLGDRVRFHGFHEDVRPFLAAADIFWLSSISEGISLTLLEAMAVGLPVVATDVGGNR